MQSFLYKYMHIQIVLKQLIINYTNTKIKLVLLQTTIQIYCTVQPPYHPTGYNPNVP